MTLVCLRDGKNARVSRTQCARGKVLRVEVGEVEAIFCIVANVRSQLKWVWTLWKASSWERYIQRRGAGTLSLPLPSLL